MNSSSILGRRTIWHTKTGKIIKYGSNQQVCDALDAGDIKLAIYLQARSNATYRGRRRDEKLRKIRLSKHDRQCFSARTFSTLVLRAFREIKFYDSNLHNSHLHS